MSLYRIPLAAAAAMALALSGSAALAAEATGKWVGDVKLPNGMVVPFIAHLKQEGTTVTGRLEGVRGAPDVQIVNGKVDKDTITFEGVRQINNAPVHFDYKGRVAGDAIDFDIVQTDGRAAPLKTRAVKTPG